MQVSMVTVLYICWLLWHHTTVATSLYYIVLHALEVITFVIVQNCVSFSIPTFWNFLKTILTLRVAKIVYFRKKNLVLSISMCATTYMSEYFCFLNVRERELYTNHQTVIFIRHLEIFAPLSLTSFKTHADHKFRLSFYF